MIRILTLNDPTTSCTTSIARAGKMRTIELGAAACKRFHALVSCGTRKKFSYGYFYIYIFFQIIYHTLFDDDESPNHLDGHKKNINEKMQKITNKTNRQ